MSLRIATWFLCMVVALLCCAGARAGYVSRGEGKMSTPDEGMSVDDYMKLWYHLKYSKDCNDYCSHGWVIKKDKRGYVRKQEWLRYMITLRRESDDLDFKDLVTVINPQSVKGLSVLTWTYISPNRDQDVWLWLPSLRKIRRISQSEGDDSFIGADSTYDEVMTRKWEDETYKMIGDEEFSGYYSWHADKKYYQGLKCCVVEATSKK
ncbi:MAG: outer membrane lipoprotein-sorting protein, partial [Deltaproteobacteria bacterium]|nr:outer membrane lipoprotein-sorting protein [Deltaproteobacteria bacterium]